MKEKSKPLWKWRGVELQNKAYPVTEFFESRRKMNDIVLGPGIGAGVGCGVGLGLGVVGGTGLGSHDWTMVFGLGIGCGAGIGFGYGQGFGGGFTFESLKSHLFNLKSKSNKRH